LTLAQYDAPAARRITHDMPILVDLHSFKAPIGDLAAVDRMLNRETKKTGPSRRKSLSTRLR
jgi:hypothetical protein